MIDDSHDERINVILSQTEFAMTKFAFQQRKDKRHSEGEESEREFCLRSQQAFPAA